MAKHPFEQCVPEKPGVDHGLPYETNALATFGAKDTNGKFPMPKCKGDEMCFDSHTNGKKGK